VDAQWVDELIQCYACPLPLCPNHNNWCFVADDIHLKIMPQQMKAWSVAINNDEATVDDCPPNLIKSLMPARSSQKNPLRVLPQKPVEKAPDPSPLVFASPHVGLLFPPMTPLPYYGYPNPYPPPMYHQHPDTRPPSPHPRSVPQIASSPLRFESDPTSDKLTDYFDWLCQGYPRKCQQIKECLSTLKSEEIVYGTLTDISNDLWKDWKVTVRA